MDSIPNIIKQNPFRILGTYANAPKMEIFANKAKAAGLITAGQTVEYPLDLKEILPPLSRTVEMLNQADAYIATAKDRIKYAQFWFLKITQADEDAISLLTAGRIEEAMAIWGTYGSISALQNIMVCYLIKGKVQLALKTVEKLYLMYGNVYIEKVFGYMSPIRLTGNELIHMFIDTWGTESGILKMSYDSASESESDSEALPYHNTNAAMTTAETQQHAHNVRLLQNIIGRLPASSVFLQLTAVDLCLGLTNHCFEHFSSFKWKDDRRAHQLIDQGLAMMTNNPIPERLIPIAGRLLSMIDDETEDKSSNQSPKKTD